MGDPANPITRILLVDDHQIVRDGLRTVIEGRSVGAVLGSRSSTRR